VFSLRCALSKWAVVLLSRARSKRVVVLLSRARSKRVVFNLVITVRRCSHVSNARATPQEVNAWDTPPQSLGLTILPMLAPVTLPVMTTSLLRVVLLMVPRISPSGLARGSAAPKI
jgi:hypothetical protein